MTKQINFEEIVPEQIGQKIQTTATIINVEQPVPRITSAIFECRSCMRIYEVEQKTPVIHEPAVCQECGGRAFKLLPDESKYTSYQQITIGKHNTVKTLIIILEGILASYDDYKEHQQVMITGTLRSRLNKKNFELILMVENITSMQE